jgi:cytochrome c biogenesis protein CcdA
VKERASPIRDEFAESAEPLRFSGRSLTQIFQDVVNHVSEIIRSEIRLAKTEAQEDIRKVKNIAIYFAAGATFALYALGFILLGVVYALGAVISPTWAALIVGGGMGIIAACLVFAGRAKLKHARFKPEKTIQSLEDNVTWMKKKTR